MDRPFWQSLQGEGDEFLGLYSRCGKLDNLILWRAERCGCGDRAACYNPPALFHAGGRNLTLFANAVRITLVAALLLAGLLLGPSQGDDRSEWQLAPRLARGQELVYRGTLREQSTGRG